MSKNYPIASRRKLKRTFKNPCESESQLLMLWLRTIRPLSHIRSLKELLSFALFALSFRLFAFDCFLWRISESNRWPSACKADALANWANPPSSAVALAKAGKDFVLSDHLRQGFGDHSRPEQIWTADPYIISVVL